MKEYETILESTGRTQAKFDAVIEWALIGLLAFMPLAFGVVHAWSEQVVVVVSGAIVLCFLLRNVCCGGAGIAWSWSYVPLTVFILIAVLQLIPLPAKVVGFLSPNTVALKTELLGDLPNADQALEPMTLSFYPHATAHDIRLVLAVVGVFVVVFNVCRRPDQIKRLLLAMTIIGGVVAVLALTQNIFGNGKIYWFVTMPYSRAISGPFVNHSNLGQFMNLSIGAALGLLCVRLYEVLGGRKSSATDIVEFLTSRAARSLWLLSIVMVLCVTAVFVSLTRGGIISMLVAMAFTTLLFASRRSLRNHAWIMVIVALVAFTCILYVGFDGVYDRLATLRDFDKAGSGRIQILKDVWVMWGKFPIFGTGLGTHRVMYPMFDRSNNTALATHAENEYAQTAEETGVLGLGLLIVLGVIIWLSFVKSTRQSHSSISLAAYGLGFGILAILVHSLSDFGQHRPAFSVPTAVFCALLLGLSRPSRNRREDLASYGGRGVAAIPAGVLVVGVLAIWIWAVAGADRARAGQARWAQVWDIKGSGSWQGTEQEYADLVPIVSAASDCDPANVVYRHYANECRWHSISKVRDPDTGQAFISEDLRPTILDIVKELHLARTICPTYGPIYSLVGQIEKFALNDHSGAERIRKGFRLAPCSPSACFLAGYLDVIEGKDEDCVEKFERAMQLDGGLFRQVAEIYANHLSRPSLALEAAGDNIGRLTHVAAIFEDMQYGDLVEQTREKMKGLLQEKCSKPGVPAREFISLGNIYRKQRQPEAAIKCYHSALELDYGQVQWRFELAKMLAETTRIPEAMEEARTCLQLRPQFKAAEKLLEDLSIHPSILGKKAEPS